MMSSGAQAGCGWKSSEFQTYFGPLMQVLNKDVPAHGFILSHGHAPNALAKRRKLQEMLYFVAAPPESPCESCQTHPVDPAIAFRRTGRLVFEGQAAISAVRVVPDSRNPLVEIRGRQLVNQWTVDANFSSSAKPPFAPIRNP